jgi:hypothetical protein
LSAPSARDFVAAAYLVLEALGLRQHVWIGDPARATTPCVIETNPTVALALSVRQQDLDGLPTRRRARVLRFHGKRERVIRAKSDWYWEIGGDAAVWKALATSPEVQEHDHERVAALTCLAIAAGCARGAVTCIGDGAGMYALLPRIDDSWRDDVARVGVVTNAAPSFASHPELAGIVQDTPLETLAVPADGAAAYDDEDATSERGPLVDLLLCDSGGVWETHNPWLEGCDSPVELDLGPWYSGGATLKHGDGRSRSPDQWIISPTTESLRKALRPAYTGARHNFDARLSLKDHNVLLVPARIV